MSVPKLKILVLYGGEEATLPREQLLAWLRGPDVLADARIVAGGVPHTDGAIDERVDESIEWADLAIAILTPDHRTANSPALNVVDEIGRWRGKRGKPSICIIRQNNVQQASNYDGIIYGAFEVRISEAYETLRRFMAPSLASTATTARSDAAHELVLDADPNLIFLNDRLYRFFSLNEVSGLVTVRLATLDGRAQAGIKQIEKSRQTIETAYGNTAFVSRLERCVFSQDKDGQTAELTLRDTRETDSDGVEVSGGTADTSADELAKKRASRILFDEPPLVQDFRGNEILIRGLSNKFRTVKNSPIGSILSSLPVAEKSTWEILRLKLLLELRLSGCVEHVELLRLHVKDSILSRIEFRGTRRIRYANVPVFAIEFDRTF